MIAGSLINLTIPFLKPSDSVRIANELLHTNKLNRLPVVEDKIYLGMISEDILIDASPTKKINSFIFEKPDAVVDEGQHFLEVLRLMNINQTNLLNVLDADSKFIGSILQSDISSYVSNLGFINAPGGILVLSVNQNSYSLSEISRIVESNDMKVLCLLVADNPDNGFESFITIKLNKTDLTRLIASFERFSYKIVADFHESVFQGYEADRLEMLFKYLNI